MEQKYTASEWAQIEGGHTVESSAPEQYSFVRDLNESKMYRTRQAVQQSDYRDVLDFAFLNIVTLWILYNDYNTAPAAKKYAAETFKYRGFTTYRQSATDLYVALQQIANGPAASPEADVQRSKVNLPEAKLRQFFTALSQGNQLPSVDAFFLKLERSLDIQESNYRSIRRLAASWNSATTQQKKLTVTRLLQFYRVKALRSELYPLLKQYATSNNLEMADVENPEKKKGLSLATKVALSGAAGYYVGRQLGKKLAKH